MNKNLHNILFECIKKYLWAEGGDGDAVIVCGGYKELAKEFEEYQRMKVAEGEPTAFKRGYFSEDGVAIFQDNQESIWFIESREKWTPNWNPIVIIELPYLAGE